MKMKRRTRPRSILTAIRQKVRRIRHRETYNPKYFYPRHLARSVAKHNMARAGIEHINKLFAYNWREFVRAR